MSSGSSTSDGPKYKALAPTKRQITFQPTRRTKKPTSSIPSLEKKQSSLTQMQWIGTPRNVIDLSSDDEDQEYEEPPAKRRKSNGQQSSRKGKKTKVEEREQGQNSFTQVDYFGRMRHPRRPLVDGDGFQIWQDTEDEDDGGRLDVDLIASSPVPPPMLKKDDSENGIPEIAESSQHGPYDGPQEEFLNQKPASTCRNLRTPQKVRFVEVPSSQTPPSTRPSTQRTSCRRHRSDSRSPLKPMSVNPQSPSKSARSPKSQNLSMKMLERTHFANQQARRMRRCEENQLDADLEQCAAEADNEFSLGTYRMPPPPPRRLQRTTMIQDSQAEELDVLTGPETERPPSKVIRDGTIPDSQSGSSNETLVEESQCQRPTRKLRRVATIQDSQFDEEDGEVGNGSITTGQNGQNDIRATRAYDVQEFDEDYDRDDSHPEGTYDPAYSALDRDASRFAWTQTQAHMQAIAEDSETEDEDLDRGCSLGLRDGLLVSDVASQEIVWSDLSTTHPASKLLDSICFKGVNTCSDTGTGTGTRDQHDDSAYESGDHAKTSKGSEMPPSPPHRSSQPRKQSSEKASEDAEVPSSPPPIDPSQVSTIVPTQASLVPRAPSPQKAIKEETFTQPPPPRHVQRSQPLSLVSSPHRPNSLWQPESLSSSPLPLPPWSSPEKQRMAGRDAGNATNFALGSDPQMDSLADFSLPPPPPLSSSRRQTPASSSL